MNWEFRLCGRAKANVLQLCRLVGGIAALLVLLKRWLVCSFVCLFNVCTVVHRVTANVLALGEEADFEVLNCLPALNLIRSTKLHLSTEPAFLPNACYVLPFFPYVIGISDMISPISIRATSLVGDQVTLT